MFSVMKYKIVKCYRALLILTLATEDLLQWCQAHFSRLRIDFYKHSSYTHTVKDQLPS